MNKILFKPTEPNPVYLKIDGLSAEHTTTSHQIQTQYERTADTRTPSSDAIRENRRDSDSSFTPKGDTVTIEVADNVVTLLFYLLS